MDERKVLRYVPRSFLHQVEQNFVKENTVNMVFFRDLDSFNYRQVKTFTGWR